MPLERIPLPAGAEKLVFPLSAMDESNYRRPMIFFSCKDFTDQIVNIFLPCPGGLTFTDGGEYSTISKSLFTSELTNTENIKGVFGRVGDITTFDWESAYDAASSSIDSMKAKAMKKFSTSEALAAGLERIPTIGGDIAQQSRFVNRIAVDPRINTTFTQNNLRSFNFQFKLIPTSREESLVASKIHQTFRELSYATSTGFMSLSYPPTWQIKFITAGSMKELPGIPRIYECQLTNVQITTNSSSNSWRVDASPLEIDLSVSFQETKVLTRKEINELNNGNPNRIADANRAFATQEQSGFLDTVRDRAKAFGDGLKARVGAVGNELKDIASSGADIFKR